MKRKIMLFLAVAALCLGGVSPMTPDLRADEPDPVKEAVKGTKAEISAIKSEIRYLESNLNKAQRALDKARESEAEQRVRCDELEEQLSAKRTIYKLAERRIAAGNLRAAEGQDELAAEIKELEEQYTETIDQWEMDKFVANDSNTVIDINKKILSLRKKRLKELEDREELLKSDVPEEALAAFISEKEAREAELKAQEELRLKNEQALREKTEAEIELVQKPIDQDQVPADDVKTVISDVKSEGGSELDMALNAAVAESQRTAEALRLAEEKANDESLSRTEARAARAEVKQARRAYKAALRAEEDAREAIEDEAKEKAKAEKKAKEALEKKAKEEAEAAEKAAREAARQAEKQAKEAAELERKAQAEAERQAEKQAKEARKIAEKLAQDREASQEAGMIALPPITPETDPNLFPADSKEARLLKLLELYREDKISPRDYQKQRAKILAE